MADSQRALTWILERAGQLNLMIRPLPWIEEIFPGWIDLNCRFSFEGREIETFGCAESEDLALLKAFSEGIERIAMLGSDAKNSNGFAAHLQKEAAILSSKQELRERDLFLCHFFTQTPFEKSSFESHRPWVEPVQAWIEKNSYRLDVFKLGSTGVLILLSNLSGNGRPGFVSGLGMKACLESSALSAFLEVGRSVTLLKMGSHEFQGLSVDEFSRIEEIHFGHHGQLALNVEYLNSIKGLFQASAKESANLRELRDEEIQVEEVRLESELLDGSPFHVFRARSITAQPLFCGMPSPENLNFSRLSQVSGREISWHNVFQLPHFLD